MSEKLYYWAESIKDYIAYNNEEYNAVIEIKRLNFFIGKNNAGKSRFLRELFVSPLNLANYNFLHSPNDFKKLLTAVQSSHPTYIGYENSYGGDYYQQLIRLIYEVLTPEQTNSKYELVKNLQDKTTRIFKFYDEQNHQKFNRITEKYRLDIESFYQNINFSSRACHQLP